MTLRRLVVIAAVVGLMAIFIVYERSRIIRAGYKISELSRDEVKLVEEIRMRNVQVTRLRQPDVIAQQVEKLRLGLTRPTKAEFVSGSRTNVDWVD